MKAHLLTVLSLLVYQARSQDNQFSLQGTIKDAPVKLIYLRYTDQLGQERLDSAQIRQGRFSFRGQISQPTRGLLKTNRIPIPDEQNRNITPVYLEPRSIRVELVYNQFERIRVNGSNSQFEHEQLTAQQVPLRVRYVALRDSYRTH